MNNRRQFLLNTVGVSLLTPAAMLAACGPTSTPQTISAQVIANANGMLSGLNNLVPQLQATTPPIITAAQGATILADDALASTALGTISASSALAVGLPALVRVFDSLNTVVTILDGFTLPAPYSTILLAVSVLLPPAEAYIAQIQAQINPTTPVVTPTPTPSVAKLAAKAQAAGMTEAQARQVLGIATVS